MGCKYSTPGLNQAHTFVLEQKLLSLFQTFWAANVPERLEEQTAANSCTDCTASAKPA